jgi:hypothetical protein
MFQVTFQTQYSKSEFSILFDGEIQPVKYFLNGKNITRRVEKSSFMERTLFKAASEQCDLNYLLVHHNTD